MLLHILLQLKVVFLENGISCFGALQLYSTWAKAGEEVVRDLAKTDFLEYAQSTMTISAGAAKLCF